MIPSQPPLPYYLLVALGYLDETLVNLHSFPFPFTFHMKKSALTTHLLYHKPSSLIHISMDLPSACIIYPFIVVGDQFLSEFGLLFRFHFFFCLLKSPS